MEDIEHHHDQQEQYDHHQLQFIEIMIEKEFLLLFLLSYHADDNEDKQLKTYSPI
jgi:hypothetical protein